MANTESKTTSPLEMLKARGMIEQVSDEQGVSELLCNPGAAIYIGFDPTSDSLHVGHLLPILVLAHLQRAGHRPIVLVGGATGMIGDPSGVSQERQLLGPDAVANNARKIQRQLEKFVTFEGSSAALMVNNGDWILPVTHIEWLREVGRHFTLNYMLAKESVRWRLEDREHGISYTEFSYMLLQAYDFLYLCDHYGCRIQGGGNDQWGNITAGIDLVRKVRGAVVFGITFPLVTTAGGEKFGKSAGNAVWLDPERTSPYHFYQFWLRTDDRDVERYLKLFTLLDLETIRTVVQEHPRAPERRTAQKTLAAEITRTVHSQEGLDRALAASEILFGKQIVHLSDRELEDIFADVPSTSLERNLLHNGLAITEVLLRTGLCGSKSEAQRLVEAGGVYLNNQRVTDLEKKLGQTDLASESILVLRSGKKNYHLVRFV